MRTYSYSRASHQGRRLYQLLYSQFNKATLDADKDGRLFEERVVPAVMQCRANEVSFILQGGLSGIKRPYVKVDADVEQAWGEFTEHVTTLDFTHNNQELPLSYVQPIDNDTLKMLIDAGFYDDARFEQLMSKIVSSEIFEAEGDMRMVYLPLQDEQALQNYGHDEIPFVMVDPVSVVHDGKDQSKDTTIQALLQRAALVAIELRKEGYGSNELVQTAEYEQDREIHLTDVFQDVVETQIEDELDVADAIATSSELLDQEIDVTDELKGNIDISNTSEDMKIQDIKALVDDGAISDESQEQNKPEGQDEPQDDSFSDFDDIDDYEIEDDGPSI